MSSPFGGRDLILVITPFERPAARVAAAATRAGAVGILDLGRDHQAAVAALEETARWAHGTFGVRVPPGCPLHPRDLPDAVDTVVIPAGSPWRAQDLGPGRRIILEVTSPSEVAAAGPGIDGLIARGSEGGGRAGELSTFVLLQRLLASSSLPVWAAGGIGLHTAAGAVAGGACGVVLDVQVALSAEAAEQLPEDTAAALRMMDGSETAVVAGFRVYTRPGLAPDGAEDPGSVALRLGPDLRSGWLPVGQDGPLAAGLADRYRTVGGVVQAIHASVESHLRGAVATRPLAAGSGVARDRGFRLPVAQGPMTRVSDRSAFAKAVATGGGLPFLALALMSGDEVTRLLTEAAETLAGTSWGVGILGFVPRELREAQVAAVREARPPYALIAGGRPAQAAVLEAEGIATFLHVPSPGLLERFLAEGARRFVFEGSECGGHIGPRASFPLWEAQIERLLGFGATTTGFFEDVDVLFAGGIHDELSAAMVAALAAPLAERRARIGVLMGTAYLFTREAVAAGAILPGFQEVALECDRTVLLETSPGHVTRCADTPYVSAFIAARERLAGSGATGQEIWAELEQLNLGRLRVASKGVRREGAALVEVSAGEQREAGMYMLGQVATLRSDATSVADVHEQVTSGATRHLAGRAAELGVAQEPAAGPARAASPLEVAIVGMACVMPGADGLASYWANILAGRDAVTEVPPERWDTARYHDPAAYSLAGGDRTPSKWGGFIPRVAFDALAYGIPPSSLSAIEPVQLLALEVASRALDDAGYSKRPLDRTRASAVFGAEGGADLNAAYTLRALLPGYLGHLPNELGEHLPALTEDSFPGVLANVIAGRIANRLDLGGVNYTVDAACASSLAALDVACKELRTGGSDLVLCGGADLHNGIYDYLMFASAHALSPSGRCATFDASADGIALGEGVVCVVLKRLADAERDGDRVYAVVKAVAGSSDGRSLGLTAPRPLGQRRALDRAWHMAGISPATAGLIEAHGTGTLVGDRTELSVLTEVLSEAGAPAGSCSLGSVKSQIGHTKCAAGLAGLVKTAMALHAGVRPPTGPIRQPNPFWKPAESPFFFDQEARPWAVAPGERFAGVSAFGFGGTNFHAVLAGYEGAPEPVHGLEEWPAELFCFRGARPSDALASMDSLVALLATNDAAGRPWSLRDLAAGVAEAPAASPVQVALVATGPDDLARKLAAARQLRTDRSMDVFAADPAAAPGTVAFLFPGQGSQRPGMLSDLFVAFPRLQRHLRGEAARFAAAMFPPATFTAEGREAQRAAITDTRLAQPVMGIGGLAVHELLGWLGVNPDMAGGHSYGELVALAAAGAILPEDLLALGKARAALILAAAGDDPGTMAAIKGDLEEVRSALAGLGAGGVVVANHNARDQVVISGPTDAVDAALGALGTAGLSGRRIPVACAFHSPLVADAAPAFRHVLEGHRLESPAFPVWSNTTAAPYPEQPAEICSLLSEQLARPVRFVEQVEAMYAAGARVFVEAGPGRVLTGLVDRILADRRHVAVACDVAGEPGLRRLLLTLAELATTGIAVDVARLFHARRVNPIRSGDVARRVTWTVDGHMVRTADGTPVPGGLRPAGTFAARPAPEREAAVLEFLRASSEAIAAQRDVMLGYLGAPPVAAAGRVEAAGEPHGFPTPPPPPATEAAPARRASETPENGVPALSAGGLHAAITGIVAGRTGYPQEMLGPDLDLEADLSIDSIKRTEIIMELAEHLRVSGARSPVPDGIVEELARVRTIEAIVAWIIERFESPAEPAPEPATAEPVQEATPAAAVRPERYLVEVVASAGTPARVDLTGLRFVVVDDGEGAGAAIAAALRARGADALLLGPHHELESSCASVDGVVHAGALRRGQGPVLPRAFAALRAAIVGGARMLLVATAGGGRFAHGWNGAGDPMPGVGIRGLMRTVAKEYPAMLVRAVDIDPREKPAVIAAQLVEELGERSAEAVAGYADRTRTSLRVVAADLAPAHRSADAIRAAVAELRLGPDSVVVLSGGGRGITASCAIGLARATGCRIEILGRTPSPQRPEHPDIAAATSRPELRRALLAQGVGTPAEVEAAMRRILATREVRSTLERLEPLCRSVRYHGVDVCDAEAVGRAIEEIHDRWERIDGVIHGAGVLEDRILAEKTPESFTRVFRTKVDGARALAGALEGRTGVRFLALFGSVSGVFGNPGQVDYAAANDALDTLAWMWNGRVAQRVVSVDWGPWASAGGGMVSEELEREYARRGIATISPDDGVAALLGELAWGRPVDCQVVYMGGGSGSAAALAGTDVEKAPPRPIAASSRSVRGGETMLLLGAATPEDLLGALDGIERERPPGSDTPGPYRLAIVDPTPQRLALARKVVQRGTPWRGRNDVWFTPQPMLGRFGAGRIAFLFPGFEPEPLSPVDDVAEHFDLPRPALARTGELVDQAVDIISVSGLLSNALGRLGVAPDLLAGHSLGEWTAMIAAGMWSPDVVEVLNPQFRNGELPDVAYAALGCGAAEAEAAVATLDGIVVSHDNCPHQCLVCGRPEQVEAALAALRLRGILGQRIPFRSGFHSPMLAPFLDVAREAFEGIPIGPAALPVWSATSVSAYPEDPAEIRRLVRRHLLEPVRFRELIERLHAEGVRAFVQVGGGSLTGFVEDTLGTRDHIAVAAQTPRRNGLAQLRRVVAALWAEGAEPVIDGLREGCSPPPAPLAPPPIPLSPLTRTTTSPPAPPSPVGGGRHATATLTAPPALHVLAPLPAPTPAPADSPGPVVTERVFSLATMPELADHCLVPQAPGWPDPSDSFPVVPMTSLLEVMGAAAAARHPARTVIGFQGVRALRWLVVEPAVTAPIEVHDGADGYVRVRIAGYAEGLVHMAETYPAPPAPAGWTLRRERPPAAEASRLYVDGWMFHGPRYRGVSGITAHGDDGIRGVIESLPASGAILDSAGQLAGHWAQVAARVDRLAFPASIVRLRLFGPQPPPGERMPCAVRIRAFTADTMRADLEVLRADGTVWALVEGWTCRRFATDDVVWPALHTRPSAAAIGEAQPEGWCLVRERWPDQASLEMIMRRYLNAEERSEYERRNPRARRTWLLGRIAVKDAARHALWAEGEGPLYPAQLSTGNDAQGRPWLTGPDGCRLSVSLAHTAGFGVAILGREGGAAPGIDIEAMTAVTGTIAGFALSSGEGRLVERMGGDDPALRQSWLARFWTAKEAAAKAEGTGFEGRPREFAVESIADWPARRVGVETLVVRGRSRTHTVATRIVDGTHVVAWTLTG